MSIKVDGCIVVVVIELMVSQLKACLFQNLDFKKIYKFSCFTGPHYNGPEVLRRLLDNAPSREFREGSGTGYTGAKGTTMS